MHLIKKCVIVLKNISLNKLYNSADKILFIINIIAHNAPKQEHGYTDTNTNTVL